MKTIDGRGTGTIRIECRGAESVPLAELHELQGELKSLSDEDYARLKREILQEGFGFVVHVWRDPKSKKLWILDGHQRTRVLRRLERDGWTVPAVPVSFTEASSMKKAKQRLLAAASQYGKMERQGLYEFQVDIGLDPKELEERFRFPEINLSDFRVEFFEEKQFDPKEGSRELSEESFSTMLHQCPKCGFEFGKAK